MKKMSDADNDKSVVDYDQNVHLVQLVVAMTVDSVNLIDKL